MSTHSQETGIALAWFRANAPAAEWAAAIVENGDPAAAGARLRAHVARWAPGVENPSGFYGPLLAMSLDRIDYGAVAEVLRGGGSG